MSDYRLSMRKGKLVLIDLSRGKKLELRHKVQPIRAKGEIQRVENRRPVPKEKMRKAPQRIKLKKMKGV